MSDFVSTLTQTAPRWNCRKYQCDRAQFTSNSINSNWFEFSIHLIKYKMSSIHRSSSRFVCRPSSPFHHLSFKHICPFSCCLSLMINFIVLYYNNIYVSGSTVSLNRNRWMNEWLLIFSAYETWRGRRTRRVHVRSKHRKNNLCEYVRERERGCVWWMNKWQCVWRTARPICLDHIPKKYESSWANTWGVSVTKDSAYRGLR